jgi:probable F420-dependent oxidoreductase
VITVVPVTSNVERVYPFQVLLPAGQSGLDKDSKAQAEQVRSISVERLAHRIGELAPSLVDRRRRRTAPASSTVTEQPLEDAATVRDAGVMRIGAVFPHTEIGSDPGAIRAWAQAVEELGYRHIQAFDHVLGAGVDTRPGWTRYTSDEMFHEVFVLFGYLAAITESLELATGVLVLPQRQTALVAKQAAEVDVLSGGRMRLGVGVGWNDVEYEALGESFGNRGRRIDEQIEVLRALWAQPTVTYSGRWHHIDNAGINPLPVRRRIPVWIGGTSEAALRRAGTIGDGWLPQRAPDDEARRMVERVREHARAAGRATDEIGFEARLTSAQVPRPGWAEFATGWRELGATHLCVNTMGSGLTSPDEHVAVLGEVIKALG